MTILGKEIDLNDLLKSVAKESGKSWTFAGQPHLRLWIERPSSRWENDSYNGQPHLRLWIERTDSTFWLIYGMGQPHLRLWIERAWLRLPLWWEIRSASSEAVNWKYYIQKIITWTIRVSLIWGCELKGLETEWNVLQGSVSLIWGCELKDIVGHWKSNHATVSLIWGCELKGFCFIISVIIIRSASSEAVNWKMKCWIGRKQDFRSASSEAVNWKVKVSKNFFVLDWSASSEAVNWKTSSYSASRAALGQPHLRLWIERSNQPFRTEFRRGQPHLRLWIERFSAQDSNFEMVGSASSEAVNWKNNHSANCSSVIGQPHLRLWIER